MSSVTAPIVYATDFSLFKGQAKVHHGNQTYSARWVVRVDPEGPVITHTLTRPGGWKSTTTTQDPVERRLVLGVFTLRNIGSGIIYRATVQVETLGLSARPRCGASVSLGQVAGSRFSQKSFDAFVNLQRARLCDLDGPSGHSIRSGIQALITAAAAGQVPT